MVRRVIAAQGRRIGDADPEDLHELVQLQGYIDQALLTAVAGQRRNGFSWERIAQQLGVTKQAAHKHYAFEVDRILSAEQAEMARSCDSCGHRHAAHSPEGCRTVKCECPAATLL